MTTFTYDESGISRVNTGIRVGVSPSSDTAATIELERATAGSSSSFLRIASMSAFAGQVQASMDDRLPADGVRRFYRARSVRGDAASTYTRTVSAKPATLLMNTVMTPALSGTPIGVDGWISSGATFKVGRPGSAGAITKTLHLHGAQFRPVSTAAKPKYQDAGVGSGGVNFTSSYIAAIPLPPGITALRIRMRSRRSTVGDNVTMSLAQVADDVKAFFGGTIANSTVGVWQTKTSTQFSAAFSTSVTYALKAFVTSKFAGSSALLQWAELDYTMPSYDKTI